MIVCMCNQVTEKEIKESIKQGNSTLKALYNNLGIGNHCGCCAQYVKEYLHTLTTDDCHLSCAIKNGNY
ncbi:MAG: bacterioferritin [Francisella sp.]|nr:MAG: bacterioferritin [Francisella sp.]